MVAVLLYIADIPDTDMGIREETLAHTGRIQHHMGVDFMHGLGTASSINISMIQQYLLPMARNAVTGQTVKTQDLTGARFTQQQQVLAESAADQLAERMTARTGDAWVGFVQLYTPSVRR
jgi:hypothetical protein